MGTALVMKNLLVVFQIKPPSVLVSKLSLVMFWWFVHQSSVHTLTQTLGRTAVSTHFTLVTAEMKLPISDLLDTGGVKPTPSPSTSSSCCCHCSAFAQPPSLQDSPFWVRKTENMIKHDNTISIILYRF